MFDLVQVNDITMRRDSLGAYVSACVRFGMTEASPGEGSPLIEVTVSLPLADDAEPSLGAVRSALLIRALDALGAVAETDRALLHEMLDQPLSFDPPR